MCLSARVGRLTTTAHASLDRVVDILDDLLAKRRHEWRCTRSSLRSRVRNRLQCLHDVLNALDNLCFNRRVVRALAKLLKIPEEFLVVHDTKKRVGRVGGYVCM